MTRTSPLSPPLKVQLLIGTSNAKKGEELAALLAPLGIDVVTLADVADAIDVVEDQESFAGNARKKAIEQAAHLGRIVLAEDSGLCVDALEGAPGIYSARFSGEGATDATNNAYLLEKLTSTPMAKRTAHYVCHAALATPSGDILAESTGKCFGRIAFEPSGRGGFGYDPLFIVPAYHRTFGQLGSRVKSTISHRGRAMRQLVPQLAKLLARGELT